MCGIGGYFQYKSIFNRNHLHSMSDAMIHRGPDFTGYFHDEKVGLVHNRLSIIDLSSRANQPLTSNDGRYLMVYNGEVYNFKELAGQFRIETKTTSDSEVVLELFLKRGVEFANLLNGMFVIAIYDKEEERLFLFRDRVGIKPVFYYLTDDAFVFASELKALQAALPSDWLQIEPTSISQYLHLGFISAPQTIYKNIYKLSPGEMAIVDKNGMSKRKWWSAEEKIHKEYLTDEQEVFKRLENAVNSAVQSRLVSDVPIGTFLSGGIDSSLVSAIASKHFNEKLQTFTIGFDHVKHNEAEFADKVAKHIESDHNLYYVTDDQARELLPEIISHYDEPFADTSAIPTMLVSQMAKQKVTVTLSGDGGDELFMGYGSHVWAKRLNAPKTKLLAPVYRNLLKLGSSRHRRVAGLFENSIDKNAHIFSQEQYFFSQRELAKLLRNDLNPFIPSYEIIKRQMMPSEKQAFFDFKYYLPDDLLVKVDRDSMRYALETRVPLLDYRVVELALNIHPQLKLKNGDSKYLLKKLLFKHVPASLFDRTKQGFSVPLMQWMNGPLKEWFDTYLSDEVIRKHELLNLSEVQKLRKQFESPKYAFLYNRLWSIAALHAWMEKNG
ncbi:MAG: asparagine synthase (glutamine-hydrolyzing) [Salinivirgaceae bacterium]|nr:MAG: asparagine synthase (glutamine-hydrolyzing) [Salinivirgaceae bacterium]